MAAATTARTRSGTRASRTQTGRTPDGGTEAVGVQVAGAQVVGVEVVGVQVVGVQVGPQSAERPAPDAGRRTGPVRQPRQGRLAFDGQLFDRRLFDRRLRAGGPGVAAHAAGCPEVPSDPARAERGRAGAERPQVRRRIVLADLTGSDAETALQDRPRQVDGPETADRPLTIEPLGDLAAGPARRGGENWTTTALPRAAAPRLTTELWNADVLGTAFVFVLLLAVLVAV